MFLTPELFRGDNWFFISDVSLRGEARLRELELRPGLEARLLAEVGAGPGNSELVEQDENEELLCFLPTVRGVIINIRSLHTVIIIHAKFFDKYMHPLEGLIGILDEYSF